MIFRRKKTLNEHFVNLWGDDVEEKKKLLDEVWDLVTKSYAKIGGPHKEKEELLEKKYYWKLVRRNGKIIAFCIYKAGGSDGRKLVLCGSDGSAEGKKDMLGILYTNLQLDRPNNQYAWAEVSEAIEHYVYDKWKCTPIPVDTAIAVLDNIGKGGNIIGKSSDGFHYIREIDGDRFEKMLVGYPPEHLKIPIRSPQDLALYTLEERDELLKKPKKAVQESLLLEDKVVKFNGETYPEFGWCVIMCGAPGSGKSTVLDNLVPIDAKIYNPDYLKELAVTRGTVNKETNTLDLGKQRIPLEGQQEPYTLKNGEFVSHLHKHLKPLDRKNKSATFNMGKSAQDGRLPNVAFDIAGSDIEDLAQIINTLQPMGYKFCVVWVFNTLKNTIRNNNSRDRSGLEQLVVQKYFDVLRTIPLFMKRKDLVKYVNDFWIVLPVEYRLATSKDRANYVKEENVKKISIQDDEASLTDDLVNMIFDSQQEVFKQYKEKYGLK